MDLAGRLQELEEMVRDAKSMPLSSSVLVNRDEVLDMLKDMQEDAARRDQAGPLDRQGPRGAAGQGARGRGTDRRAGARGPAADGAEGRGRRTGRRRRPTGSSPRPNSKPMDARAEAESYVDARLAQFEIALRRILEEAQSTTRGAGQDARPGGGRRDRLRAPTTAAEQEFGTEPEAQLFDAEEDR